MILQMTMSRVLIALFALSATIMKVAALDNGLARTPVMGWNSWNLYACNINEDIVKSIANALVSTGLRDLGYKYVTIDDCWQQSRNETGHIQIDTDRFPSGMASLSDYIHSLDLKFGIYSSAGTKTCEGRPGSLNYELIDAQMYASWGVDLLKYDNCANKVQVSKTGNQRRYGNMRDALNKTGRPIVYMMCNWGQAQSWKWASEYANSWRITGDIGDLFDAFDARCPCTGNTCWMIELNGGPNHCSVTNTLDKALRIAEYSSPGGFNDLDMLEVGNGGMTVTEYRTHFSLWCVMKSPLMLGNDVANMTQEIHDILSNDELIAVSQDPLGVSARLVERISRKDWTGFVDVVVTDVIVGSLSNGDKVVVLFNRDTVPRDITLRFGNHFGLANGADDVVKVTVALRDLWQHKDLGLFTDTFVAKQVQPHEAIVLRASSIVSTRTLVVQDSASQDELKEDL